VIGWGRPVPVNYHNLRNVDRDSLLVAMAGPAMNVVLLVVAMIIVKLSMFGGPALKTVGEAGVMLSWVSMGLFFFNLIPVPPLDGSHILRYVTRMSWETFAHLSHFGFLAVIILIQLPPVKMYLNYCTAWSVVLMQRLLQVG
jgi:Zn-dependent protease